MKKIFKKIKWFIWEFFHNSPGPCDGKKFKMTAGWVIYFIVGAIICILFFYALLWIESGQISFDAISIIWAPEETYGYRIGYFGTGIAVTPCFLLTGYLTSTRINGDKQLLEYKRVGRLCCLLAAVLIVGFFIAAVVVY